MASGDVAPGAPSPCISVTQATANLATTIIGAGIMALPRAFATLGVVVGAVLLVGVLGLSFFSLASLVRASDATGHWNYKSLVSSRFGAAGRVAHASAVLLNNAGSMVVYLIIMGDVLVGVAPSYSGVVTNLVGVHDPRVWYVSRPFVVGVVCVACLAPLLSLRNLRLLAPMSAAAVAVAGAFGATVLLLTLTAIVRGRVSDFHWLPTLAMLGGTRARAVINVLAVLPVITMCFVCHYNVLPLASNLQRFTDRRMMMVIRRALLLCTAVFTLVAGGGYVLFGSHTDANILNNLTPEGLQAFVPHTLALLISFGIRAGYCMCLMATFAMLNWALRETVSTSLFGVEELRGAAFNLLSYAILAILYAVSIAFPSVWTAMSLTGSTAAVLIAFILPGAVAASVAPRWSPSYLGGVLCVALGALMGAVGVANTLWLSKV